LRPHTPLYRQTQIFARHGIEIDRSTLANWVGGACGWLEPLQVRLAAHVFGSPAAMELDPINRCRGLTHVSQEWTLTG
jgi:hypothetical protein